MKRILPILLGVLAFSATPLLAQEPAKPMGKIQGHVINPVGTPQSSGTVSLTVGGGPNDEKATFPVNQQGEFGGDAPVGTYVLIFRQLDTPKDKQVDRIENVKIIAGQTTQQEVDMSRPEFIKTLPPEQQKQLEELKQKNSQALKSNSVIKQLNADLAKVQQDIKDADAAPAAAQQQLGATPDKAALAAKIAEIKQAKYSEVEQIMSKDTAAKQDASILYTRLGQAQVGLKKFPDAETALKKAIEVESASKKPNPEWLALAQTTLGEAYARQNKIPEAQAAYDDAAKTNPAQAAFYYKNEAIVFFQQNSTDAQVAAADKAIALAPSDPNYAIVYYIKGNGLVGKTSEDPTSHKLVAPPGCMESYQKYVELAPTGQFTAEVKGILQSFNQAVPGTYKAEKKKK